MHTISHLISPPPPTTTPILILTIAPTSRSVCAAGDSYTTLVTWTTNSVPWRVASLAELLWIGKVVFTDADGLCCDDKFWAKVLRPNSRLSHEAAPTEEILRKYSAYFWLELVWSLLIAMDRLIWGVCKHLRWCMWAQSSLYLPICIFIGVPRRLQSPTCAPLSSNLKRTYNTLMWLNNTRNQLKLLLKSIRWSQQGRSMQK